MPLPPSAPPRPDWDRLNSLASNARSDFGAQGVSRVEFVVSFVEPFTFWLWLGTASDDQRDALAGSQVTASRLSRLVGLHALGSLYDGFSVESQETVDREYAGSWFYRLR